MDPIAIGKKIKQAYPQYANADDAVIGNKYLQKYGGHIQAVQAGQVGIKDIPEAQRVGVGIGLDASGYKAPEAAAAKKSSDSFNSIISLLDSLEKSYTAAGGATYGVGPGARIKGAGTTLAGKVGLNEDASVYNDAKEGFAATLKTLTGDTGVLTDQDFARLSKLLPSFGATKKETIDKFNQMRTQVSAKFGGEETKTKFQPSKENNRGALASLVDVLLPKTVDLAEKTQKDLSTQLKTGNYKNIIDLILPKSKEDVGLIQDVIPAGIETGSTISAVEGIGSGAKKLLDNVFGGKAKAIIGREAAAKAVQSKVSTESILKAGDTYVVRDPTAAQLWTQKLRPALEANKELSVPDLLEQIKVWNDAYSSAGKVGKTALAGLNDALARSAKEIIKTEAPEVAKYTAKLAKMYGLEKLFGKFGPAVIGGAGAGAGGLIIGNMLGQQKR